MVLAWIAARRPVFAAAGSLVMFALAPRDASSAPIEFAEQRDTYMIFDDVDGGLENANWFARDPFLTAYGDIEAGFLAAHPDDSEFLIVYTTWSLTPGVGALYQAVANDVQGIGYERIAPLDAVVPAPIFDDTPNSRVFGFMHMNRWTQYLGADPGGVDDSTISLIFGQELGHAWLAFPHVDDGGGASDRMLGRAAAHWSFYMHTSGSPVEGHTWTDNGDGTFTANKVDVFSYSDLDLYLMGLLPPADVQPWFLIDNPSNCVDSALPNSECAPREGFRFEADSYTVNGTRRDITIDEVIAAEGPRVPAAGDAPTAFNVSFLLLKQPDEELLESEKEAMDAIVQRSIGLWESQTRGLGELINRTAVESPGGGESGGTDSATGGGDGPTSGGPGGDGGGTAGTSAGSGGGASGGTNPDDGCSCRSPSRGAPQHRQWHGAPWWGAVLLGVRRRKRKPLRM